ncbi:ATP-dependent DNA ligase [Streptomyces sp. NPDC058301]|uniref:ATP-dependent DNA ligase n=1 Tax=Streptomyces sp. NPDC058301 TaxID=3346436 RepID=UPI0036E27C82
MVLGPPVEPMLAQARETLPGPKALSGGLVFEAKFDGYRALLFTPSRPGGPVLLQTRRGSLLQRNFPDLVRAAEQLPAGLVLDGELVVWVQGRFSFEVLQRRAVAGHRTAAQLADAFPAHYIAFDVLQSGGEEILALPYERRRAVLEALFADRGLTAPWTLCPSTTDPAVAQEWLTAWTDVQGVEGLVIKGRSQRYLPGERRWLKVRRRHTTEAVIGAVIGTLNRPQVLVLGRYDDGGRLRAVGRTVPLGPESARQVAGQLRRAAADHPWTGVRFASAWNSREALDVTLVAPEAVAEVDADLSMDRGTWRHPLRFARVRLDVTVSDVPLFGEGAAPSVG